MDGQDGRRTERRLVVSATEGMEADAVQGLMQRLRAIGLQMRELSSTARLLIGAMMIILVMGLVFVGQFASQRTMVPLPVSALSPEQRTQALEYLERTNMPFKEQGSSILVPADQQFSVLASLTEHALIDGESIDFSTVLEKVTPFDDNKTKRQHWLTAKMAILERIISGMSGIADATVVIGDRDSLPGIGKTFVPVTASVSVATSNSPLTQKKAEAIAHLVAGSHADLKPENVKVTDTRTVKTFSIKPESEFDSGEYVELAKSVENVVLARIAKALSYIPGVIVSVNAIVDHRMSVKTFEEFEEPRVGPLAEESEEIQSVSQPMGGEAGVAPNTGVSIRQGGGSESQYSSTRNASKTASKFPRGVEQIRDPKGYPKQINATVNVPRSYFVRVYQAEQNDPEAEPDQQSLDAIRDRELVRIKAQVEPLVETSALPDATRGTVEVSMIPDFALTESMGAIMQGGTGGLFGQNSIAGIPAGSELIRYVGLGSLALISLAMMFMMVKRANVQEDLPTAEELVGIPPALEVEDSDLVGEAEESPPALEGLEVDDDAIRIQQMVDQVNEMVMTEPGDAAQLLRRWVSAE